MDNQTITVMPRQYNALDYNSVLLMTMSSMFAATSTKVIGSVMSVLGIIMITCYQFIQNAYNKIFIKKCKIISINLTKSGVNPATHNTEMRINPNAQHIVWYLTKHLDKFRLMRITNFVENVVMMTNTEYLLPAATMENAYAIQQTLKNASENNTSDISPYRSHVNPDAGNILHDISHITDEDIEIEPDIFIQVTKNKTMHGGYDNKNLELLEVAFKTEKKTMAELYEFVKNIKAQYNEYILAEKSCSGKIFVYVGTDSSKQPCYNMYQIDKTQTFDTMFFENKDAILNMIHDLENNIGYNVSGVKKKLCLMASGASGTGKSAMVSAIANKSDRCIILIHCSRVDSDIELEKIMYGNKYNDYIIENHQKILFFDELDSLKNTILKKRDKYNELDIKELNFEQQNKPINLSLELMENNMNNRKESKGFSLAPTTTKDSQLNVGVFLSLLDGIHDQTNMIIVGAVNSTQSLDAGFFRNGRLTHIPLEFMNSKCIIQMIEKIFDVKVPENLKVRDDKIIPNSVIKNCCRTGLSMGISVEELVEKINNLTENSVEL